MNFKTTLYRSLSTSLVLSTLGLCSSAIANESSASLLAPKSATSSSTSAQLLGPTQVSLTKEDVLTFSEKPEQKVITAPTSAAESPLQEALAQSASPQVVVPIREQEAMAQVNSVFQMRDVSPGDWAYEALQNLVNRYNCVVGYPDGTFRGNRALSRYEFAAALNACLQVMERAIAEAGIDSATQDDLETSRRLMTEFEAELALISTQVDGLESRVSVLEDNAFSTTTKLFGQTIIGLQGRSGGTFELAGNTFDDRDNELFVSHTTQLSLFTQFSPRSLLFTSFAMGDGKQSETFSDGFANYIGLAFHGDTNNQMQLSDLNYRHLFGRNFAVMVGPKGISPVNVFRGTNRIESAGTGPLSSFAQRNPIFSIGSGQGGLGIDWQVSPEVSVQGVYASNSPNNTTTGLFGGDNGTTTLGFQATFAPSRDWDISAQYINSYSPSGNLPGTFLVAPGVGDQQLIIGNTASVFNLRAPMTTNAFGLGTEVRITPDVTFGGWVGHTVSNYLAGQGLVKTLNWMSSLSFPDLGGEGNLAAIFFGQPPRITNSTIVDSTQSRNIPAFFTKGDFINDETGGQPGTTYHIEAFYRIQLNDNISVTPGVIIILNPLQNANNETVTIGALRTTFSF